MSCSSFTLAFVFSRNYRLSLPSRHFSNCLIKHGAQKARSLSVQHRYLLLCSLSIHSLDQRACDTNPEILVQRCTTRKQSSDNRLKSFLPTHTNQTSVSNASIPMKCGIHARFETRKTSNFGRPNRCCKSWLSWLTLVLFTD